MNYRIIEQTVTAVKEQLTLFEVNGRGKRLLPPQIEIEDWDFADANTKTETHGFHSYPAMMIPQIARSLIHLYGHSGQTLIDPFCGSGTALVEARIHGLNSYGIDINPLALLLAKVKSTSLPVDELKRMSLKLCDQYLKANRECKDVSDKQLIPNFFNIAYWFHPKVSRELFILRSVIEKIKDVGVRDFFLVAFSQMVRDVSYTRSGEFKLFKIPDKEIPLHQPNVPEIFFKVVDRNLKGMADFVRKAKKKAFVKVLDEDTRFKTSVPSQSIDLVITSPPYGDSRTTVAYGQFSRLSLQWLGLPWERVRRIDTESLGGKRYSNSDIVQDSLSLSKTLRQIQKEDRRRAEDVASFFFDFELCLREINRVCRKKAVICFVVGNRTVKGIRIPTDQIVAEMGDQLGFRFMKTIQRNIPNKRMPLKNSPSNVEGKLGDTMTKEHIVILEKKRDAY